MTMGLENKGVWVKEAEEARGEGTRTAYEKGREAGGNCKKLPELPVTPKRILPAGASKRKKK